MAAMRRGLASVAGQLPPHLNTAPIPPAEARQTALSLYRSCLRSARRIPTYEQRSIWVGYLRSKYKESRDLRDPVRLRRAFSDGYDQLSRMNYFHEVREKKEREAAAPGAQVDGSPSGQTSRLDQHQDGQSQSPADSEDSHRPHGSKAVVVAAFLEKAIPGIGSDDLQSYTSQLVDDGFDSPSMLALLMEEDVGAFKKAHRRAVMREVERLKQGPSQTGGC